jgi:hypothetical protein
MTPVPLTVSGALAPWLIVIIITIFGAAAGVIAVQRIVPDVLAAARDPEGQARATTTAGTARPADGDEAVRAESATGVGESKRADTAVGPRAIPDTEAGTAGVDREGPHRFGVDDSTNVVERLRAIEPVDPRPKPAAVDVDDSTNVVGRLQAIEPVDPRPKAVAVDVDDGVSAVRPTGDDTERIGPIEMPSEPATMTTVGLVDVVSETVRLEAVETAVPTEPADEADGDAGVVCEYCGRDDFETVAQRNGHLRWCEQYDPDAIGDGEPTESEAEPEPNWASTEGAGAESTVADRHADHEGRGERAEAVTATAEESSESGPVRASEAGTETMSEDPTDTSVSADATNLAEEEREGGDVIATYAAVRRQLREELDITNRRTSREFYHVCRSRGLDEERLAALERLTQAYETVQYSNNPDLDVDEIRAAAARFETVEQ